MADTVELMRKRVLDMAVRGELVEQRPEEGTAEQLYSEISLLKTQMIKDKVLKKENVLKNKVLDAYPFDIPDNWKWTHFGEVIQLVSGRDLETKDFNDIEKGIPYITGASNLYKGELIVNRWTKNPKVISQLGDLLITVKGTVGDMHIQKIEEAHIARQIMAIRNVFDLDLHYMKYFLDAQITKLKDKAKSMIPGVSREDILLFEFPLPPLAEQKRIIDKIEEIFAVIDQIGEKKEEALTIIQNMRQTALQEAIMGMLVEQDEDDEPADILYKKIQAEKEQLVKEKKIKKEKPLPEIEADEVPFEIPETWKWVRLGELSSKVHYGYTASAAEAGDAKMLRITDIQNGGVNWDSVPFCLIEESKIEQYLLNDNDILIARTGGTVGKSFIVKNGDVKSVFASYLIRVVLLESESSSYIAHFLNSPYYWNQVGIQAQGTGQPNVNATQLSNLVVPLPPLAEQRRIVEKLDTIMAICDQMATIFDGSAEKVLEETLKND